MGQELTGKVLGLVGVGNIGSLVSERALGLRLKVIAFDPFLTEERVQSLGIKRMNSLEELIDQADVNFDLFVDLYDLIILADFLQQGI